MNKQSIIDLINKKYTSFIDYMANLNEDDYQYRNDEKWTAGEQLAHIILCVKPLVSVLGMDNSTIEQNFGATDRVGRAYEEMVTDYQNALKKGGKAPQQYLPEGTDFTDRPAQLEKLEGLVGAFTARIENFSEEEIDTLCIPHPLLKSISMREMLYNAIYHVEHHQKLAEYNLEQK